MALQLHPFRQCFLKNYPRVRPERKRSKLPKTVRVLLLWVERILLRRPLNLSFLPWRCFRKSRKKAQAELDAVVGRGRLPDFNDYDSLPFINALVKETLRWQPVLPVGVPHYSTKDDEYEGYFFPKGTLIIGNAWSILHDPEMYPEPEEFRPDRFLKDGKPNPDVKDPQAAFGYGRRICPGQYIATRSLWAIVCSVLSVFDIAPPLDGSGKSIQLQPNMADGLISYPLPFECIIKPRSDAAAALVRHSVDAA